MQIHDPLISTFFSVTLDGFDFGAWTQVDLGGVDVVTEEYTEGGNPYFTHTLVGQVKYQNIKLTRQVNPDTAKVAAWFRSMAGSPTRSTGQIVAYANDLTPMNVFSFAGAIPVRWQLPTLAVDRADALTEVLEIAHEGFSF